MEPTAALVIPVENHYVSISPEGEAQQEKCLRFCPENSREEVCFSVTEFCIFVSFLLLFFKDIYFEILWSNESAAAHV